MTPAPLLRRFVALCVDALAIVAYAGCLLGVASLAYHVWLHHVPDLIGLYGPAGAHAIGFIVLTLPVGTYFVAAEASAAHATLGKRLAGIRVLSSNKQPVAVRQIIVRTIIKLLPWELAHTAIYWLVAANRAHHDPSALTLCLLLLANLLPLLYVATVVLRRDHRAPHDMLAGTVVVAK